MVHGKRDRCSDEALLGRLGVQLGSERDHRGVGHRDHGTQRDLGERAAAAAVLPHRPRRSVGVRAHDDSVIGRDVQVREHVALAERGQQQLLGVPAIAVAVEGAVARAGDLVQLAGDPHDVLPPIRAVAARALAAISLPLEFDLVPVFAQHRNLRLSRRP